jgi:hypothetical protein
LWRGIGIAAYKRIKSPAEGIFCRTFDIFRVVVTGTGPTGVWLGKSSKIEQAKSAYSSLVRIFGNEIKRKREEVLIKVADD